MTAPSAPDAAPEAAPASAPSRSRGVLWVSIVTAVIGGFMALGVLASVGVFAAGLGYQAANPQQEYVETVAVGSPDDLVIDVGSGALDIGFGDVEDAELTWRGPVTGGADLWRIEERGGALVVERDPGTGGWLTIGPNVGQAMLVLPARLDGQMTLDLAVDSGGVQVEGGFAGATATVSSGVASLSGDFGATTVQVDSGAAHLEGSFATVQATLDSGIASFDIESDRFVLELSSGLADVALRNASHVAISVESGSVTGHLEGPAPDAIELRVASGEIDLAVPDAAYQVDSDVSSGQLDLEVDESGSGAHRIAVQIDSGQVSVHRG